LVFEGLLGFVDANVLANCILAFNRINELKDQVPPERLDEEINKLWRAYDPSRNAFSLFSYLWEDRLGESFLVTSHLALLEVTGVLAQEYRNRQLWLKHVPFRNWLHLQPKINLTQEDYSDIRRGLNSFLRSLNARGIRRLKIFDSYKFRDAEVLVTNYSCDARDAILVACALKSHSPFFITEDERLRKRLRTHPKIKAASTQDFLTNVLCPESQTFKPKDRKTAAANTMFDH